MDLKRNFGLDLVRATAISFVLICHYTMFYAWAFQYQASYAVTTVGFIGVGLFFPLSGFLLGRIIFAIFDRNPDLNQILRFYVRRWMRTVPAYLIVLIATYEAIHFVGYNKVHLLKYVFFVQNFLTPYQGVFFGVSWSLAVEEWFYVLFPAVLYVLYLLKVRNAALYAILLFLIAPAVARYLVLDHAAVKGLASGGYDPFWDSAIRKQVPLQLDSIVYGVLAAYLTRFRALGRRAVVLIGAVGVALLVFSWYGVVHDLFASSRLWVSNGPFLTCSIGAALTVVALSRLQTASGVWASGVRVVSLHAYTLYLVHCQCFDIMGAIATKNGLPTSITLLAIPLTALSAFALTRFVEQPIMRLRPAQFRSPKDFDATASRLARE
ncbi:peptidoglycan/LPS O-acetylase OafA/YrhL [Rhodoblastus acidophilus]|uniref:acyltransferase family protein n=1 Tax=Rhodoblastus acidophilus TaxID=1074 RepID=UPI00222406F8|nr:acyltransferase [Rhodoblastus acidophilus]MCW2286610.1 peptidoglycan/LPS O-acetylase OafA/YrhL [Rhodoblastus acidophilus]MCW2335478.1 peptidoglycan/LPS O-acetylase OafA/YrhL [Rhodoblastus acidophilus]